MMKKGIELSLTFIAQAIVGISALIVLVVILTTFYSDSEMYDKGVCKMSVLANSKVRMPGTNVDVWDVDCPTRFVTFLNDGYREESKNSHIELPFVSENGKKINMGQCNLNSETVVCDYIVEVYKKISDLYWDCWDQMGRGELSVFSQYDAGTQCVLCSIIDFDNEVAAHFESRGLSEILGGYSLLNFMTENSPLLEKLTYFELTLDPVDKAFGDVTDGDVEGWIPDGYEDLAFDDRKAIIFIAMNDLHWSHNLWQVVEDFAVSLVGGETTGDDEDTRKFINMLKFVNVGEVSAECNTLAGQ